MDLFNPLFCFTFLPGLSIEPFADLLIFFTFKSSRTTTAWFLLIDSELLCKKSLLAKDQLSLNMKDTTLYYPAAAFEYPELYSIQTESNRHIEQRFALSQHRFLI
jgi:hypothetical protein